jgi:hypothetical protein
MAKHVFRFPIGAMSLALLFVSIPVLADNTDPASAQPDFDRAVALSFSGFGNNSESFFRDRTPNTTADGRFISELCFFACEFQSPSDRITIPEISRISRYQRGDYPDFGKDREGGFFWKKHGTRSVPEPSSLTLLGASALAFAFNFRKRLQR